MNFKVGQRIKIIGKASFNCRAKTDIGKNAIVVEVNTDKEGEYTRIKVEGGGNFWEVDGNFWKIRERNCTGFKLFVSVGEQLKFDFMYET